MRPGVIENNTSTYIQSPTYVTGLDPFMDIAITKLFCHIESSSGWVAFDVSHEVLNRIV